MYDRVKEPLITLMNSLNLGVAYTTLNHVNILVKRQPDLFADRFKRFYLRSGDSTDFKSLKLDILVRIATRSQSLKNKFLFE